ncbi:MAG: DUF1565 domain-containing protein [Candidatus Coatesbacteria bacterium]|nr:DUF1565 domain-containing protein [Candidatus Coatesbacteria bacterium]
MNAGVTLTVYTTALRGGGMGPTFAAKASDKGVIPFTDDTAKDDGCPKATYMPQETRGSPCLLPSNGFLNARNSRERFGFTGTKWNTRVKEAGVKLKQRLLIGSIVLLCAQIALGIDLYVDPINGDDSRDGLSWQTALKTMTRASQIESGPGCLFLGEGVFSVDSGEVFPISLTQTTQIRGISPEKTLIAVGNPPETIIWTDWRVPTATMSNITFFSTLPGETDYGWEPFVVRVYADIAYEDLLYMRRVGFVAFVPDPHGLTLIERGSHSWDTRIEECCFLNCEGLMLADESYNALLNVSISDCLIQPVARGEYDYSGLGVDVSYNLTVSNCVFRGTVDQPVFFIYGTTGRRCRIINCLWQSVRFQYESHALDPEGPLMGGSTFRDSVFSFLGAWHHGGYSSTDIVASIFDGQSYIEIKDGVITADSSYVENSAILHGYAALEETNGITCWGPAFAEGPLGGSYLSNVESGQEETSLLVDALDAHVISFYWELFDDDWPPSGSTTRTDGVPDEARYDLGYHYPSVPPPAPGVTVRTDRTEYPVGDEMQASMTYENRGVKVEGAIDFAFGPDTLDWLIFWPWMTFIPTPWVWGTLWSGVSYQNLPPTTHTIPGGLAPGRYLWLGAVLASDGTFASDIALWPVTITAD